MLYFFNDTPIDIPGCFQGYQPSSYGRLVCYNYDSIRRFIYSGQGGERLRIKGNVRPTANIVGPVFDDDPVPVKK
jgi:hypothetical protein